MNLARGAGIEPAALSFGGSVASLGSCPPTSRGPPLSLFRRLVKDYSHPHRGVSFQHPLCKYRLTVLVIVRDADILEPIERCLDIVVNISPRAADKDSGHIGAPYTPPILPWQAHIEGVCLLNPLSIALGPVDMAPEIAPQRIDGRWPGQVNLYHLTLLNLR